MDTEKFIVYYLFKGKEELQLVESLSIRLLILFKMVKTYFLKLSLQILIVLCLFSCESKKQTEVPVVQAPTYREVVVVCSSCRGTGQLKCKQCNGSGKVDRTPFGDIIDCDKCQGYGFFVCSSCGGNGKVTVKQEIK